MTGFYNSSADQQVAALRDLADDALRQYSGQFSTPELVKYRENAIFSVRDQDGSRFALRIHRPNYHTDGALASELSWMQALAQDGLPVPDVRLNLREEAMTLANAPLVPETRRVDLITWVQGEPLSKLEERRELSPEARAKTYRALGKLMARIHDHGATWERSAAFERHAWFTDALVGEAPLWGRFWNLPALTVEQQRMMISIREEGLSALSSYPRHTGNSGLIHADLIADNLMVDGENISPIDFDDAGFGWHIFDIATTLYFVFDQPDFHVLRSELIEGYREVRHLPDCELAHLPLFLMLRGTTYLGWVSTRQETETARDLAPYLIHRAILACDAYQRA